MEELVDRSKKGDNEAFSSLIISLQSNLYKIAKMRLQSEDDVNEAVQSAIVKAYSSIKSLHNSKYFKTWLIKILINECNNIYRINSKQNFEDFDNVEIEDNLSSYNIERNIDNLDFNILLKFLNYDERIAIMLFYAEDLTSMEISKILGEPESTIRTRLARARSKLKQILEKKGENNYGI